MRPVALALVSLLAGGLGAGAHAGPPAASTPLGTEILAFEAAVNWSEVSEDWTSRRERWARVVTQSESPQALAGAIATLEENMGWEAVEEEWTSRREAWVAEASRARTMAAAARLLLDLEAHTKWTAVQPAWKGAREAWVRRVSGLAGAAPAAASAPPAGGSLQERLQGRWTLSIPNMRSQELVVQGDRATRTIFPEEGVAGQKKETIAGRLVVVDPHHVKVEAAGGQADDFYVWWDREGGLHLHSMSFFRPVTIAGREGFVIEDEGTGTKLSYDAGKCRFSNYEITTPKAVACGFTKQLAGVVLFGGATEIFYYAIPGKEREPDPYLKNEIYYVDGNLLVPSTLAMSSATR